MTFETGLADTVAWYQANAAWVDRVRSGAYRSVEERPDAADSDRRARGLIRTRGLDARRCAEAWLGRSIASARSTSGPVRHKRASLGH